MKNKFLNQIDELFALAGEILNLPKSAISILNTLVRKKEATLRGLMESTRVSRRTAHEHLKRMRDLGMVRREVSEVGGRLMYVYSIVSIPEIIEVLKRDLRKKLERLESLQKRLGGEGNE